MSVGLLGTPRCGVTGGKAAGTLRPLGARTAEPAVPTSLIRRFVVQHIPCPVPNPDRHRERVLSGKGDVNLLQRFARVNVGR